MQSLSRLALAAALSVATLSAQAALVARPGGMVRDTVPNITWLADMNYAQTSLHTGTGVNVNGTMTWDAATERRMRGLGVSPSELLGQSCLLQHTVGGMPRQDFVVDRERRCAAR